MLLCLMCVDNNVWLYIYSVPIWFRLDFEKSVTKIVNQVEINVIGVFLDDVIAF